MTLPIEWIFPLNEERLNSNEPKQIGQYVQELITTLNSMYKDVSQGINGDIKQFTPEIFGDTVQGTATYSVQDGWVLRQGLIVDVWYSLTWSAHTGSGIAYIQLPYKVKNSLSDPFIGTLHGKYNYTGGQTNMFTLGSSNTFKNYIYADGPSGMSVVYLQLETSGQLYGHIRYIGQEIEN